MNYFRITGYCPDYDFCFIIDSNGKFEKLWQFSAYLVEKGLKVLEVSKQENMEDINIKPASEDNELLILRANSDGMPEYITHDSHKAIKVGDKIYIPDKTK